MLDEVGLTARDGEGYRLRSDGSGRLTFEIASYAGSSLPYGQMSEMIRAHWQAIGINAIVTEGERTMIAARIENNDVPVFAFVGDGNDHLFTYPNIIPLWPRDAGAPLWGQWHWSNGESGVEPDPTMKGVLEKYTAALIASDEDRIRLGQEIWATFADNVYIIGCVGLSPAYGGRAGCQERDGQRAGPSVQRARCQTSSPSRLMSVYFSPRRETTTGVAGDETDRRGDRPWAWRAACQVLCRESVDRAPRCLRPRCLPT